MSEFALICFAIGGLCGLVRLLLGPSLADRVIALDVILVCFMGAVAIDGARRDDPTNLIIIVVLAIVGFAATVAASRFVEDAATTDRKSR